MSTFVTHVRDYNYADSHVTAFCLSRFTSKQIEFDVFLRWGTLQVGEKPINVYTV